MSWYSVTPYFEGVMIIIPFLEIRKLRHREVTWPADYIVCGGDRVRIFVM